MSTPFLKFLQLFFNRPIIFRFETGNRTNRIALRQNKLTLLK